MGEKRDEKIQDLDADFRAVEIECMLANARLTRAQARLLELEALDYEPRIEVNDVPCRAGCSIAGPSATPIGSGLTFGAALAALKAGYRVAREGWNGKGMWLAFVGSADYSVMPRAACGRHHSGFLPWIGMHTADSKFVPWLASQTDMLADDWVTVEFEKGADHDADK